IENADGSNTAIAQEVMNLTAGYYYLLIAHSSAGSHDDFGLRMYNETAAGNVDTLYSTTEWLLVLKVLVVYSGAHRMRLVTRIADIGDYQYYSGVSFSRCLVVDGASQTGGSLALKGMPVSTDRVMKAGDFFAVMTDATAGKANPKVELKRLLEDL